MIARSTFITAQTLVTVIDVHRCKQSTFISCHVIGIGTSVTHPIHSSEAPYNI